LLKPAGGGGTDPRCVFEWVAKRPTRPEACVMLTDGYIGSDWGTQPEYPVMWAITSNHKSPWGVSIKLED
jgi:predicted metal-dependent peptidase